MLDKIKFSSFTSLTAEQQRIVYYIGSALIIIVALAFIIWRTIVVTNNQQRFNLALEQLAMQQVKAITNYQQTVLTYLREFSENQSITSTVKKQSQKELEVINQLIQSKLPGAKEVRVYFPGEAQSIKDKGGDISFVLLTMINNLEKLKTVYPEVSRTKGGGDWEILWTLPINEQPPKIDAPPLAILYASTTLTALKDAVNLYDDNLGQTRLTQDIRLQKQLNFLNVGQGGNFRSDVYAVPNSHWKVEFIPSIKFVKKASYVPFWIILLVLILTIISIWIAYHLAKKKSQHLASLYHTLDTRFGKKDTAINEREKEHEAELSDPIYLTDQQAEVSQEDQIMVSGSNQKKQSATDADPSPSQLVGNNTNQNQEGLPTPRHIFRAYDIRGIAASDLSPELVEALGKAIASEALQQGETCLLVGYDARTHSPKLKNQLQQGILSTGCNIIDIGLAPTPLLNFATVFSERTNSGVIVTASHNPKDYNGFKVVLNQHSLVKEEILRLQQRIEQGIFVSDSNTETGSIDNESFQEEYFDAIAADIAISPDLHIVIDAANGAASLLAPSLFERLGCEVSKLFCDYDGDFPNHEPDPSIEVNLHALINQVKESKADLGIALDGDGDRLVVVSSSGKIVWPDQLLMLFARDVVSKNPGCDVIFDIKSTRHLSQIISSYGGRPILWKTGHSNIKAKMRETNAMLAGEFSGHIFFKERWHGFDDGIYAAARLLEIMSLRDQSLDHMLAALPIMVSTGEIRIPIGDDKKFTLIEKLIQMGEFSSGEKTTIDGLRVDFAKGWGLVRASNTAPALTLRFEADTEAGIEQLKNLFKRELQKIDSNISLDF